MPHFNRSLEIKLIYVVKKNTSSFKSKNTNAEKCLMLVLHYRIVNRDTSWCVQHETANLLLTLLV